ncbi:MAG: AraC family transcriptional regulator ligand-binding domain-containing protein [Solimonas sp.]
MPRPPLPFITLPNWVKAAALCGFNIEPVFDELGIETDLIHLEDATIARPQLERAMSACVTRARGQHFPFVLGETFAFDYLPDIATFLATSPTLRDATRVFEWVRALINPLIDVRLDEDDDVARLVLHGGGEAHGGLVAVYFVESIFAAIAKFGRLLSGDVQRITCLRFRKPGFHPWQRGDLAAYTRWRDAYERSGKDAIFAADAVMETARAAT